jgi:UDP-2,3-diacylglucosamine hydrolase
LPFTAFISDLHLTAERPAATEAFLAFLRDVAPGADALYVLGDLFEYWAGDDALDDPFNARVAAAIGAAAARAPVYLIHGNRDFLLLDGFARAAGVRLLPERHVVELYGERTLLMHGDLLCTDDRRYQAFRRVVRNRLVQRVGLLLPLATRQAIFGGARRMSAREIRAKPMSIMDVNQAAVIDALRSSGCGRLIHGHTHRPGRHEHLVDGQRCERWVLSDWYTRGQYLRIAPGSWESIELPFPNPEPQRRKDAKEHAKNGDGKP